MRNKGNIPVLMFHSVRPRNLINGNLSVPLETFADCMRALAEKNYRTATLQQLYEHKAGKSLLPEKSVILTFDDGFLDNWIFVYPILEYYSLCAVVFPSIDFIGDGQTRKTLRFAGKLATDLSGIDCIGSLRWSELKAMSSSGVFDVQSHTMTHNRYFCAPKIADFTGSGKNYSWMAWNLFPARKCDILEGAEVLVPDGLPVWEHGRALGVKRFFPSADFVEHLGSNLREKYGEYFYREKFSDEYIDSLVSDWLSCHDSVGEMETDALYLERARHELLDSRMTLERKLDKSVRFLCWPGGARTDCAMSIVKECGYIASTSPSAQRGSKRNAPGENPEEIWRIGSCMRWSWRGIARETSPEHFIAFLDRFRGCSTGHVGNLYHKLKSVLMSRELLL